MGLAGTVLQPALQLANTPQRPGDLLACIGLGWYLPTLQPEWELHGSARAGC
jgi:hypothetical protein